MGETRKLAAILVSDVVGYSRLAGADEDRILARLRTLRSDLIDPIISVHHGRIVKRTGDGAIVEFRSVVDAVNLAIEVQRAMVERNAEVAPDKRIEFRIGIHLGDVVEESDGDLMGDGVNIASRLQGVAKPGAICLSEDAYRQVKGRLDLAVSDLGPTQLKNIAEPIRVYALEVGRPAQAKPVTAAEPATRARPAELKKRSSLALLAVGVAALLIVIAGSAWYFFGASGPATVASNAEAARLSIVVLPFANLSGDPGQDYLVDALTDELITSLARIRGSFVIARNTAMTFKGKPVDAKAIGKDLGVRYVLEGSVQPSGDRMRVNAQLIDAGTGAHLWAEQFDTPRADLLQMQDEIVTRLARAMDLQLTEAEAARLKRSPAANPDAEDLALQCVAAVRKAGYFGGGAEAGYGLCDQALALDPNSALALNYLAIKSRIGVGAKADLKRADELVSKSIALDPNSAQAHVTKAYVLLDQMRLDEALAEDERTLALDPTYSDAYVNMGDVSRQLGRFEKSLEYVDKAIRISPREPILGYWYDLKAQDYFGLKQYDQAIEWARRAIALSPNYAGPHRDLIAALALSGHEAEAREALQRFLALPPGGPAGFTTIAGLKAYQAQRTGPHTDPAVVDLFDRRIDGLRKAGLPEE